jgi:hypothetical protein
VTDIIRNLKKIKRLDHLALPKVYGLPDWQGYERDQLSEWLAEPVSETESCWLLPCSHRFPRLATDDEIELLRSWLGRNLPVQLIALMKFSNGPKLFRLKYSGRGIVKDYWISIYNILSIQQMLLVNQEMLDNFFSWREWWDDDIPRDTERLNYLAFCDIRDGNYLALLLDETERNPIFFLDHELPCFPYGTESTRDAYLPVAASMEEWLEQLVYSKGGKGIGEVPLHL